MNRRAVIAGIVATTPLLSGCSETGTGIHLEPRDVRVVGDADGEPTWDVSYVMAYGLSGHDDDEGFYGVRSHLVDTRGRELDRIEHGDLAWSALPTADRTKEDRDGRTVYDGTSRVTVSATTDRFPRWIVFTVDRVVASGRWIASVNGVTATEPVLPSPATDDRERNESPTDSNRTGTNDGGRANETVTDPERLEVAGDDWTLIELNEYESFPPTERIANATQSTNETRTDTSSNHTPSDRETDSDSSRSVSSGAKKRG